MSQFPSLTYFTQIHKKVLKTIKSQKAGPDKVVIVEEADLAQVDQSRFRSSSSNLPIWAEKQTNSKEGIV